MKLPLFTVLTLALASTIQADIQSDFDAQNYAAVKTAAKKLLSEKASKAEGHYWLGRVAAREQDYETAVDELEEAVDLNDNEPRYHSAFGQAACALAQRVSFFRQPGLASDCLSSFKKAVELAPDDLDARQSLMQFYLGAPAIAGGSEEKAMEQAKAIAKRDSVRGASAMASVYEHQQDWSKAVEVLDQAIAASSEPRRLQFRKALVMQRQQDWPGAWQLLNELQQSDGNDADVVYQTGRTALMSENPQWYPAGSEALQRYLAMDVDETRSPSKAWAALRLGQLLDKMGNRREADTYFELAAKDKKDEQLQKTLKDRAPK